MAAYASLLSLMHIIDQIQQHPRPPVSLDTSQVESLTERVTFLQDFLEGYSHVGYSKEADGLESRIADAAYAAEDIIESHIVDQMFARSTSYCEEIGSGEEVSSFKLYQGLQKVIEDMDFMKMKVMEIKEKMGVQDQLHRNYSVSAGSLRFISTVQNSPMVGFDDVLYQMMDKLTGGQSHRQIIPIVGMGGIGKTTLARNIYANPLIVQHFDICAWATISQEYTVQGILKEFFCQVVKKVSRDLSEMTESVLSQMNENELGEKLYKSLSGRRYLIVMDDMWSIEVWEIIKFFFPDYNNGSRIVITTRLSKLASQLTSSCGLKMRFLDEDESWNLFCKTVFRQEGHPLELMEIGKKIVKGCRGLPLSIVVIGGLLAKSKHTREYWEYIRKNLNSIVNSEDNEMCLNILYISYSQLPVYLKPCFLYMGVFPEDEVICVSMLIKLWVAEGFLKPISDKSLEEIAEEYLKKLIDRNLILVHALGSTGNIKYCTIHDLLRDLCLREAQKERFYNVTRQHSPNIPQGINTERRIVIPERRSSKEDALDALRSMPLARSLICHSKRDLPSLNFQMLRILKVFGDHSKSGDKYSLENMFLFVNLRYLAIKVHRYLKFPSSIFLPWNLHTLVVDGVWGVTAPDEIWNMPQLRHVEFRRGLYLPNPQRRSNVRGQDVVVLRNLQTLETIINFKCSEEVVKRIPNITKLKIICTGVGGRSHYCPNNLEHLHKLKSFSCSSLSEIEPSGSDYLKNLTFPHSLKKLTLKANHVHWEDMLEKIGTLPHLERLKLHWGSFKTHEWETVEGQFCSLKFLLINYCDDLEYWTTESSHFPHLEHLVLRNLYDLKEIPSDIGEIPTLKLIEVQFCRDSAVISAKEMLEEQEKLGNDGLQVRVKLYKRNEAVGRLATPNFQVQYPR